MTNLKRILTLPLVGLCLAAAGCGGEEDEGEPIPSEQADALLQQLDVVQNRLDNGSVGACQDIFTHAESPNQPAVEQILTQIPRSVDPEVRSALQESFARLWDLVGQECDQLEADQPAEPAPEPDPVPEPEPAPEEPTDTAPTDEVPTDPGEAPLPGEGDGDNDGEVPGDGGVGDGGGGVGPGGGDGE